jgi:sporulation protein YlmC with PRC-barrel domain
MKQSTNGSDPANNTDRKFGHQPTLLSATSITGDEVCNLQEERLGTIQDIMLDVVTGRIRYAVLSSGGFLGMGDRLFAIPWQALHLDSDNKRFTLDIDTDRLKKAPGFDKNQWPDMADATWNSSVETYFIKRAESRSL